MPASCAEQYLRSCIHECSPESRPHLQKAAELYAEVHRRLTSKRDTLPLPWELFPWQLRNGADWTPEMRRTQARVLIECKVLEQQAMAEIKLALEADGGKTPDMLK